MGRCDRAPDLPPEKATGQPAGPPKGRSLQRGLWVRSSPGPPGRAGHRPWPGPKPVAGPPHPKWAAGGLRFEPTASSQSRAASRCSAPLLRWPPGEPHLPRPDRPPAIEPPALQGSGAPQGPGAPPPRGWRARPGGSKWRRPPGPQRRRRQTRPAPWRHRGLAPWQKRPDWRRRAAARRP